MRGSLEDLGRLSRGCEKDVYRVWEGCLKDVGRLSTWCGKAVSRVWEGCLEDVEDCLDCVGWMSRG